MKSSRFEKDKEIEESMIKDVRNLFRLKKIVYTTIKNVRNLFRLKKVIDDTTVRVRRNLFKLKKENETIKDRIIRYIRIAFEQEDDYYKPIRVGNF